MLAHWDEVERRRNERGPLRSWVRDLGTAAGSRTVGVTRWEVDPGKRSTPVHVELHEEEIFFVLAGSGLSLQEDSAYDVRAGDCIVHLADEEAHTLVAGSDGLDVLAFGMRGSVGATWLPRAGVVRGSRWWVETATGATPWEREVAAGEPEVPAPSERPLNIVSVDDVEGAYGGIARGLGAAAGSEQTGLNHLTLPPGETTAPAHVHSAEEELFVVLDGEGALELTPTPIARERGMQAEEHPLRRGHVIARPPGGGTAHRFRAGAGGMTMLAYGTRDRKDVAFYPASNRIYFRALGVVVEAAHVGYPDD